MKSSAVFSFIALAGLALGGCASPGGDSAPAVEYQFESDAAAHTFYQTIINSTTLPLQTKTEYLNTPILVIEHQKQVSAASITRDAAAKADTDGDLFISEAEAEAFAAAKS